MSQNCPNCRVSGRSSGNIFRFPNIRLKYIFHYKRDEQEVTFTFQGSVLGDLSSFTAKMFRKIYKDTEHKCDKCKQHIVMAICSQYLAANEKSLVEEEVFDDILNTGFAIVKQKRVRLSDAMVDDWLGGRADPAFAAQFTNGSSLILLLNRRNSIEAGREMGKFHNMVCKNKIGKPGVYASANIIDAQRDTRLLFPEVKIIQDDLTAVREYANSHIVTPLTNELAALRILSSKSELSQSTIKDSFGRAYCP